MPKDDWLGALASIFTIIGGLVVLAEVFSPKCTVCGTKLIIVNNNYYCKHCHIYTPKLSEL